MRQATLVAFGPFAALALAAVPGAAQECRLASLYELSFAPVAAPSGPQLASNGPTTVSGSDLGATDGEDGDRSARRLSAEGERDLRFEAAGGWNRGFYDAAAQVFAADASATLRNRFRFGAGAGVCIRDGDDDNPLVLGASASAQLFGADRERLDVVAQVGINRYTLDESTVLAVPVIVGAGVDLNEHVTAYGGPVFLYARNSMGGGEFFYSTSDNRLGGLAGLQWLTQRPIGLNASVTVFRGESEGYDLCDGEPCERSSTEWRPVASLRLTYGLGGR